MEDSIDLRGGPLISLILSRDDKHFYDGPHTKRTVPAKGGNGNCNGTNLLGKDSAEKEGESVSEINHRQRAELYF